MPVPYRIETPRLVMRCYAPTDASLLQAAVNESREHLAPWMPAAQVRAEPLALKVQRLRLLRADYDLDKDYTLGLFDPHEKYILGGVGLHKRGSENTLELGYWIHQDHVRKGYATEAVQALTYAAFAFFCVGKVEIRCDPNNAPSVSVAKKSHFVYEETLKDRARDPKGNPCDVMVWGKCKKDALKAPFEIKAYDAAHLLI